MRPSPGEKAAELMNLFLPLAGNAEDSAECVKIVCRQVRKSWIWAEPDAPIHDFWGEVYNIVDGQHSSSK